MAIPGSSNIFANKPLNEAYLLKGAPTVKYAFVNDGSLIHVG